MAATATSSTLSPLRLPSRAPKTARCSPGSHGLRSPILSPLPLSKPLKETRAFALHHGRVKQLRSGVKWRPAPGVAFASLEGGDAVADSDSEAPFFSAENLSQYKWLLAPLSLIPVAFLPGIPWQYLKHHYWIGFFSILLRDVLFVILADLFLSLADRFGKRPSSLRWIPPFETSPWPNGYQTTKYGLLYLQVGLVVLGFFLGPPAHTFPLAGITLVPYVALLGIQEAYERILSKDKIPSSPLAPILYSFYRLYQIMRSFVIIEHSGRIPFIGRLASHSLIHLHHALLATVFVSFTVYLAQLPWIYSNWTKEVLPPLELDE